MPSPRSKRPRIVYFSSVTENTKHLVDRLPFESKRIPLRRSDPFLHVTEPYVLFVPSYGGGQENSAVPKQVVQFLNDRRNRELCLGIVSAGNMNFGEHYCIAGKIISQKLHVPVFYRFEIRGMPGDTERIEQGLREVFERYAEGRLETAGARPSSMELNQ
jgi:protein involved in ribonucleotide reduction